MANQKDTAQNTTNDTLVIKKYANRRLYNTATSQYITLDDLSVMVREGTDFTVQDAKTQKDLTRTVLAQIIFEHENNITDDKEPMLPISFLRQIIGLYGDSTQTVVSKYLDASMQSFIENQERIGEYLKPLGISDGGISKNVTSTFNSMARNNMQLFQQMVTPFGGKKAPPKPMKPEEELASIEAQFKQLQERIAVIQENMQEESA